MPQEKITIKFEPKGHKPLIAALNRLAKAQKAVTGEGKAYNDTAPLGVRNNRLLANSFATLRSKLLLVNFAMAMGVKQLIQFVEEASKVESMGMAFDTLSGGTENASIAMEKLQEATNGTMNQFDLFQQANNAMILGVSKNSDEMAEMFDVAQRLGQALGRDTASSVESLITGIGRQSRLMLDNIGIIVKAEEAYEAYANGLNKTVDQLTDTEKKQAFLNATMESARAKVASLDEEIIDMQMRMQKVSAEWANARSNLGNLAVSVLDLDDNLKILGDTAEAYNDIIDDANIKGETWDTLLQNTARTILNMSPLLSTIAGLFGLSAEQINLFSEELVDYNGDCEEVIETNEEIGQSFETAAVETDRQKQKILDLTKTYQNYARAISTVASINQDASKANALAAKRAAQLEVIVNTASAIMNAGKTLNPIVIASMVALGAAQIAKIEAAKYEQGGLIGGRRHSQGGTMINAEAGEFIMSRSAVDSVGIENLNRMNEGGSSSAVTVNVSGNVLSQDFVEGELAENIKEAIRRGTDFGIS